MNTKLIGLTHVMLTQMTVSVDRFGMHESFYYPPVLQIYHDSTQLTSYDRKNQTNSYNFLQINRIHAFDSSVSCKPIFVDFTLVFNSYWQFLFSPSSLTILFCFFCTRYKHYEFFHSVCQTLLIFQSVSKHYFYLTTTMNFSQCLV